MPPPAKRRRAKVAAAVDLLERQACNCMGRGRRRVVCLRCELLDLLGADPTTSR